MALARAWPSWIALLVPDVSIACAPRTEHPSLVGREAYGVPPLGGEVCDFQGALRVLSLSHRMGEGRGEGPADFGLWTGSGCHREPILLIASPRTSFLARLQCFQSSPQLPQGHRPVANLVFC